MAMKKRRYSSSPFDSLSSSSSSVEEASTKRPLKITKDKKKRESQEKGNPSGKASIIAQQPPIMIRRLDNGDMSATTLADVKVYPDSYVFEIDMPGLKSGGELKVDVEDDDYLVISGERKREEGVEYERMERRIGKFMRKFVLPKNANTDVVSAMCQDGVLSVTVQKLPRPSQPKKARTVEVRIA